MKVAIISPYATVVPHFETELDIAQQHLDQGDSVEYFGCQGALPNCDENADGEEERCRNCKGRREMGVELLSPKISCADLKPPRHLNLSFIRTKFNTIDELKAYKVEGFDLGYAALSSLVSHCRDPQPDLKKHEDVLSRFLKSGWATFQFTQSLLKRRQPDRVYVFNGRFAAMRAVFRACQMAGVDCFLHERGCDLHHFEIVKNHMLHDIDAIEGIIRKTWLDARQKRDREQIGSQWYLDRVNRVERNWHSFVKDQDTGCLPKNWDRKRRNVGIFCSSDDEFAAIGDTWVNRIYPEQVSAIKAITADSFRRNPEIYFTVRLHPNLKDVENRVMHEMLGLQASNLQVIPPDSGVDSYQLLRECEKVVTFGSSVGMEAVFWDRPSILLGPCYYQNLPGVYRPTDHESAIRLISEPLPSQTKTGALMYGYWLQTRGFPHKYYHATGLFEGKFKNELLYAKPPKKGVLKKIKRHARRLLAG